MDGVCLACGSWSLEEWGPPSELDPLGWVDLVECISCGLVASMTAVPGIRRAREVTGEQGERHAAPVEG